MDGQASRDPLKQEQIEKLLAKQKSKAYGDETTRLIEGVYRTDRSRKTKNLSKLKTRRTILMARMNKGKGKKGNEGQLKKLDEIIPMIEHNTDIEESPEDEDADNANERARREIIARQFRDEAYNDDANANDAVPNANDAVANANDANANADDAVANVNDANANADDAVANANDAVANADNEGYNEADDAVVNTETLGVKKKFQFKRYIAVKEGSNECIELFDPCTKEPLANFEALEKRIREIRSLAVEDNPETKKFPDEIKTRLDLFIDLLNKPEPPSNALFKYTINGQLYEAYWDIVFALNLIDDYTRTEDFYMISKKAEHVRHGETESYMNDPLQYLKGRNVNEGASGASDISFCYKSHSDTIAEDKCSAAPFLKEACSVGSVEPLVDKRMRYYFCSSKFYKNDSSKSAESFDIQKIYTAVKKLHENSDVRIILLVKDKNAVSTKLKNARNKYISEEASKVYGEKDLFAALLKIYDLAHQKIKGEINENSLKSILGITDKIKPILSPRLHQHMAILKIEKAIKKFKMGGDNNKFLVGILPRGGKTYIAGGLVSLLQPKRVVVLLGAKSETISQFTNDLFRYYQDFADYHIVDVVEDSSKFTIEASKKYIFVMSAELYKMEGSTREILIELKQGKNKADLFICDEAHLKQTTEKAIKAVEEGTLAETTDQEEEGGLVDLEKVISSDVPIIFMSGTYIKPLKVFKIPDEHVAIWEYQDIQMGKNIVDNEQYFKNNFPGIYEEALEKCIAYGETLETIQEMYKRFPNLYLISTHFTNDAKDAFLKQGEHGEKVGFPTLTHLFQVKKDFSPDTVKPSLWHTGFTNVSGIARLINYLSPKSEIENIDEKPVEHIPSVMKRIDKISQRIGDRLAFFTKEFVVHSQLWFLPSMQGHPLIKRMSALGGIIFQSAWYKKHFNILAVSSSADWSKIPDAKERRININGGTFAWACPNGKDTLKACILQEEATARAQGKGLIILAQNMLHLGISLTCVDIVVLLDSGEKVDERIQKMYRALTESTNKKGGFIVDMNYFRTVTAIMNYQIQTTKARHNKEVYADSGLKEAFNSIIETYSIDDDLDIYSSIEEGGESRIESETIPELQRILQKTPTGHSNSVTIDEVGAAMNKNIETALKGRYDKGYNYLLGEISNDPETKIIREHGSGVDNAEEEKDQTNKVPRIKLFSDAVEKNPVEKRKAFNDIFKTALKIGVFGTSYKTLPELLDGIKVDGELNTIIYETLVKRGSIQEGADPREVKLVIEHEIKHIISEKKDGSYRGMKETFNSKDSRSQRFEDVLNYIVDHLAPKDKERQKYGEVFTPLTLVDEMLSKLPAEIWSEKDYKWLDPANGIGNFPIKAFIGQKEGEHKYIGLFEGLKKKIPEDAKRCKWIIENMLYMIDINGKNNLVAKKLFEKLCPGAKANIEKIDAEKGFFALKSLIFNGKAVKDFDIIIGNPPFNPPKGETGSSGNSIWQNFVMKSYSILKDKGYLLFVHPPGWKKPTDEVFKPEKFANGDYMGQIRQGQVWQVLKDSGIFKFVYTNDQKVKTVGKEYLLHFPAVDYYVYQKGGDKIACDTKNIFLGKIEESKGVKLNYNLKYIPNLITKQTQDILHKVTSKEGDKPDFGRGIDERGITWVGKTIDWLYDSNKSGFQYKKHGITALAKKGETKDTVNIKKVVINFGGGIDAYNVKYISDSDKIGVLDMTMYSKVDSDKDGKQLEAFFNSDIVKFIFLITQYASGKMTKNEPLVANSITIPSEGTVDYYKFFDIEEHKKYIEDILAHYEKFKAPKRGAKTEKVKKGGMQNYTRKLERI